MADKAPVKPVKKEDSRPLRDVLIKEYLLPAVVAVVLALFMTNFIILNATVPSESMQPTIMVGDRLIGSRLAYTFSEPEQGDIIFFRSYETTNGLYGEVLVKRVIATGGDRVKMTNGVVYVNDIPLDDEYVTEPSYSDMEELYVPENCCFVMGDNRTNSYDSRYWENPYVNYDTILAKAVFRYYPGFKSLKYKGE